MPFATVKNHHVKNQPFDTFILHNFSVDHREIVLFMLLFDFMWGSIYMRWANVVVAKSLLVHFQSTCNPACAHFECSWKIRLFRFLLVCPEIIFPDGNYFATGYAIFIQLRSLLQTTNNKAMKVGFFRLTLLKVEGSSSDLL